MPKTAVTDTVEFTDTGILKVMIDGVTYTLARPKIGQLRALDEAWQHIADEQQTQKDLTAGLDDEAKKGVAPRDFAQDFVDWYRQVFSALSDKPLPEDDDDLPGWFVGAEAGNEWRPKWKAVPWVAGAKPSEQMAAAQMAQLAPMMDILSRLDKATQLLTSANGIR